MTQQEWEAQLRASAAYAKAVALLDETEALEAKLATLEASRDALGDASMLASIDRTTARLTASIEREARRGG